MRRLYYVTNYILSILFSPFYLPHILCYVLVGGGEIQMDVDRWARHLNSHTPRWLLFLFLIHTDKYYRNLFYYRIGPIISMLISWYRPGDRYFKIPSFMNMGGGCLVHHPYATVLNAERIGRNFSCAQCTTIGFGKGGKPIIGDNVTLGANVIIIGKIHIGNNVTIGAGSVVVKDIPDNCIVVGNPAHIIRRFSDI